MKRNVLMRAATAALCGALCVTGLAGCASVEQTSEEAQAQAANREYMSDVNATIGQLSQRLEAFDEAVGRGDAVTMRIQAEDAFKVLDSLEALEAPDALSDIRQGYLDGCDGLRSALSSYIDLYVAVSNGTIGSDYDERLASIQDTYNQAVDKLKSTDEAAAAL